MSSRGLLAVGLCGCMVFVFVVGCNSEPEPPGVSPGTASNTGTASITDTENTDKTDTDNTTPTVDPAKKVQPKSIDNGTPASPGPKPFLENWPKPALAIVLSGEQHGYFEPCGCTENQSGGVSHRADLFRQLSEKGIPLTAFDLGGTIRRNRRQSQIKFETILAALKDMRYQAVALGVEELRLGADYLLSQNVADPDNPDASLAFLAANVVLFDTPELGTPVRWKLVSVGDWKIGVTAVLGQRIGHAALLAKNDRNLTITDPEKVLPGILKQLQQKKPDLLLLLSHATLEESRKLAKEFPEFDLVLSAGGVEDPDGKPEMIGDTMLLTVGHKGKGVGVVGYFPDDEKQRLRFELVDLDQQRFQEMPKIVEHMRYYQNRLKEERLIAQEPAIEHPSGSTFVGAHKCEECHTKTYKLWEKTKHASAFETLKHPRKDHKDHDITRVYDAECIVCHVVGWNPQQVLRYKSGFLNEEFVQGEDEKERSALLQGVQCESCHGPGSRHVELAESGDLNEDHKLMHVSMETAKKRMCYICHDLDNSPNFKFDEYWEKVKHKGLD